MAEIRLFRPAAAADSNGVLRCATGWSVMKDASMTQVRIADADLQAFLAARSPLWLAERLVAAAGRDPALRAELEIAALGGAGVDRVRQELDRALWVVDYVDEEDAPTYVAGADRALGLLGKLIDDGATDETATLAEHAIDLLADAVEKVQDEQGRTGESGVPERHRRCQRAHVPGLVELQTQTAVIAGEPAGLVGQHRPYGVLAQHPVPAVPAAAQQHLAEHRRVGGRGEHVVSL